MIWYSKLLWLLVHFVTQLIATIQLDQKSDHYNTIIYYVQQFYRVAVGFCIADTYAAILYYVGC